MQILGPSFLHGPQGVTGPHTPRPAKQTSPEPQATSSGDRVEISSAAEAAIQATETEGARHNLLSKIRNEIASGTYETPEKMDLALDRILDQFG